MPKIFVGYVKLATSTTVTGKHVADKQIAVRHKILGDQNIGDPGLSVVGWVTGDPGGYGYELYSYTYTYWIVATQVVLIKPNKPCNLSNHMKLGAQNS